MHGSAIALAIFSFRNSNLKEGLEEKKKKKKIMDLKHGNITVSQLIMLVHSIYVYICLCVCSTYTRALVISFLVITF